MPTKIVYCSFDRFPSPKGAATHIDAFVTALGQYFGQVDLVTLPSGHKNGNNQNEELHPSWRAGGVEHHPLNSEGGHLIERATRFRRNLLRWWSERFKDHRPAVVHFRSIFEGYPIAQNKNKFCDKIVFEVNGLPSVELKYHYPLIADDNELLNKIRHQENVCLKNADSLIAVSEVTKRYLVSRGVAPQKITVIPNGVDLDVFSMPLIRGEKKPESFNAIYSGTMSSWQGVLHAIEAISLFRRDANASLLLVGPYRKKEADVIRKKIDRLGLGPHVILREAVSKQTLCNLYHQASAMIAPLTRCDRNTVQGCCPLKIIEAMASGIPVISSRIAVVEELVEHDFNGLLVKPNSSKSIKDALFRLREEPGLQNRLTTAARRKVESHFTWPIAIEKLIALYRSIL